MADQDRPSPLAQRAALTVVRNIVKAYMETTADEEVRESRIVTEEDASEALDILEEVLD